MMVLAALLTAPVSAGAGKCEEVLAKIHTVYVEEGVEIGEVAGLLNGALFFRYNDKEPIDPAHDMANLVITTKVGDIYAWVAGPSEPGPDGSIARRCDTVRAVGTGAFAGKVIQLTLIGTYYPEKGGDYEFFGTICAPIRKGK